MFKSSHSKTSCDLDEDDHDTEPFDQRAQLSRLTDNEKELGLAASAPVSVQDTYNRASIALHDRTILLRDALERYTVALSGFDPNVSDVIRQLNGILRPAMRVTNIHSVDMHMKKHRDIDKWLVISHQLLNNKAINKLANFRVENPHAVVVLISPELTLNDLTRERGLICDTSVRSNCSPSTLISALCAAFENSEYMRLHEMYHWRHIQPGLRRKRSVQRSSRR